MDNASSNNEAARLKDEFPWTNIIPLTENKGFCGGCNEGMQRALKAGADYIMLLNNDTLVTPSLLEDLLKGYKKLDKPGAVSPLIMHHPETDKIWFSEAIWKWNWRKGQVGFALTNGKLLDTLKDHPPYKSMFACGCCLLVSSAVVKEIGLFDERYFAFFDEAEWCARMKKKGYDSFIIPSAKMYHKVGGTIPSLLMTYLMTRNGALWVKENLPFAKKCITWIVFWKNLVWHYMNAKGWIPEKKRYQNSKYSKVVLKGFSDYRQNRFGKWSADLELIINDKKK